ncbi:hypothetical protein [Streptomyces sp. NRRL WC-3742]|uniref:hypothetical protein n=1 Tax=Streptomyces sp. NRRL WC-3742 TaxID=1463934 RepID=UPI000A8FDC16|nr:hypothetical protein [Streptomyces sp. NRRL WC-3742]
MIATAPIPQDSNAAGPAATAAFCAPNSHPDPMIAPTEAQSSPATPTSRFSPEWPAAAGLVFVL